MKNHMKNGTTKCVPADIWKPGHDHSPNNTQAKNLRKAAARVISRNETAEFHVGDRVRIKMTALFSKIREQIKKGNKKGMIVHYSPDIYTVVKCLRFNPKFEKQR